MFQRAFEQIQVGEVATLVKRITEADVRRFVEMTGDDNPLHVNRAYAETTPLRDIVVHGMLGASFISTIIGTKLPGEGALWVSQTFDFLLPVRLGDELTISCTVTKKHERERLLELDAKIVNQHKAVILTGKGKVKLLEVAKPVEPVAATPAPKVALVTGGTGGIGRAICSALAADGHSVVVHFHQREDAATALVRQLEAAGHKAISVRADVGVEADISALLERAQKAFGGISVLVNNAAPKIGAVPLDQLTWSDISHHLDVQVKSAFLLSKACVPAMQQHGGCIINISSQVVDNVPTPTWTAYAMAKAALSMLSRSLAVELGPSGIRVNCVAPGMTDTALVSDISEKARLMVARQAPLRRLAVPDDVAGAVAFLASDRAKYITGQTLRVNGGQVML